MAQWVLVHHLILRTKHLSHLHDKYVVVPPDKASNNIVFFMCKSYLTQLYFCAFDLNIREVPTLYTFKKGSNLKYYRNKKIPGYYLPGDRYCNVLQITLRNRCSVLNSDLYRATSYIDLYLEIDNEDRLKTKLYDCTKEMISICPLWTFPLYVATFQQHLISIYFSVEPIAQSLWCLSSFPQ
jgi:hypothetical protein